MPTRGKLGHSLLDDDAYQDWSDDEDDEDQYLHLPNVGNHHLANDWSIPLLYEPHGLLQLASMCKPENTGIPISYITFENGHTFRPDAETLQCEEGVHSTATHTKLGGIVVQEEAKLVLASIEKAIDTLGGAVSPKLNWSCPKDAVWVATGNTHRCTNADEVKYYSFSLL